MDFAYYIMTPFTWLLMFFYNFFNSYGVALILFALVVKLILFPLSLKGKRSMIQMNMLSGKMQKLQKQYGKDQARYNEEVQKLYAKENVNPMGGCLWSMLPLLILLPLYAIIRQPLKYMMGLDANQIAQIANTVDWGAVATSMGWATPDAIQKALEAAQKAVEAGTLTVVSDFANNGYNQLYLASLITPDNLAAIQAAVGTTAKEIFSINFHFLGIDLSQVPNLKFWVEGIAGFGLFLIPIISAGSSVFMSLIMNKTNNLNNTQQNDQVAKTNRTMMLISPLISLWIGFSMPAALSVYWIANNILGLGQELICGKLLKKDYEKAAEAQRQREIEEKEEEKRQRREKAEERARQAEEARKNKGKKKAKEPDEEKMTPEQREASRVGIRQYARGRAYDPDRYGGVTPYHEDLAAGAVQKIQEAEEAAEDRRLEEAEKAAQEMQAAVIDDAPSLAEAADLAETAAEAPAQEEAPAEEEPDLVERLEAEISEALADDEAKPKED